MKQESHCYHQTNVNLKAHKCDEHIFLSQEFNIIFPLQYRRHFGSSCFWKQLIFEQLSLKIYTTNPFLSLTCNSYICRKELQIDSPLRILSLCSLSSFSFSFPSKEKYHDQKWRNAVNEVYIYIGELKTHNEPTQCGLNTVFTCQSS